MVNRSMGRDAAFVADRNIPSLALAAHPNRLFIGHLFRSAGLRFKAVSRLEATPAGVRSLPCFSPAFDDMRATGPTMVQPRDRANGATRLPLPTAPQGSDSRCAMLENR
jgi:hypothetical protein